MKGYFVRLTRGEASGPESGITTTPLPALTGTLSPREGRVEGYDPTADAFRSLL
jgi:hypothetical protein